MERRIIFGNLLPLCRSESLANLRYLPITDNGLDLLAFIKGINLYSGGIIISSHSYEVEASDWNGGAGGYILQHIKTFYTFLNVFDVLSSDRQ